MKRYVLIFAFIICANNIVFARQGYVLLRNRHKLSGDITVLSNKSIRLVRLDSTVVFSKDEVISVFYEPAVPVKNTFDIDQFLLILKNNPELKKPKKYNYDYLIKKASQKTNLSSSLIKAVVEVESGFNNKGLSHKGAQGLMQLMPKTARSLGVKNPFDPQENILGGSRYLRKMLDLFDGNLKLALAAYNAGPHTVKKYGAIPPYKETINYVKKVIDCYEQNNAESSFFEYKDDNGCLHLSNYLKNGLYRPAQ